jgi:hypothetical protein
MRLEHLCTNQHAVRMCGLGWPAVLPIPVMPGPWLRFAARQPSRFTALTDLVIRAEDHGRHQSAPFICTPERQCVEMIQVHAIPSDG